MFYHLLESSHRDVSNKWSNIDFGEGITQVVTVKDISRIRSGALLVSNLVLLFHSIE